MTSGESLSWDYVRDGDWVHVVRESPADGPMDSHEVHYRGTVVEYDRAGRWHWLELMRDGVQRGISYAREMRLVEHRPQRQVGWHEVTVQNGAHVVRWWSGTAWQYGPVGERFFVAHLHPTASTTYLGKGSQS